MIRCMQEAQHSIVADKAVHDCDTVIAPGGGMYVFDGSHCAEKDLNGCAFPSCEQKIAQISTALPNVAAGGADLAPSKQHACNRTADANQSIRESAMQTLRRRFSTKEEIHRAETVREIQRRLGWCSDRDLAAILFRGRLRNARWSLGRV